ncbi:MAG: nucleotidyltransferase family protein [Bacteroidota bacterium]
MKAVLLAAGKGTRLGSITAETPKPLLSVRGTPVLRHLAALCAEHGVTDLCINTHYLAERIHEAMGDGSDIGLRIHYSLEKELLGTAGALRNFQALLGSEAFFVIYGDNFMDYDLGAFAAFHHSHGGIGTVALYEKEDVRHSGIAVLDEKNRITRFIEKPTPEQRVSHLVNCGLYILEAEIFDDIPAGVQDFGKDVFPALLAQGKELYGMVMDRPLIAIDTVEMYQDAMLRDNNDHSTNESDPAKSVEMYQDAMLRDNNDPSTDESDPAKSVDEKSSSDEQGHGNAA